MLVNGGPVREILSTFPSCIPEKLRLVSVMFFVVHVVRHVSPLMLDDFKSCLELCYRKQFASVDQRCWRFVQCERARS